MHYLFSTLLLSRAAAEVWSTASILTVVVSISMKTFFTSVRIAQYRAAIHMKCVKTAFPEIINTFNYSNSFCHIYTVAVAPSLLSALKYPRSKPLAPCIDMMPMSPIT